MPDVDRQVNEAIGHDHATISLQDATWDQILTELERRYQGVLLVALEPLPGDETALKYGWKHGYFQMLGMLERIRKIVNNPPEPVADDEDD